MTDNLNKSRTQANAGGGIRAANSPGSDAARSAADGEGAGDVIRVDLGTHADGVARLGGDGSHDADRYRPALSRVGMRSTGQLTNHTKGNNFR